MNASLPNSAKVDKLPISFEFFPPRTPESALRLQEVRQSLYALQPEFCSVTYGAGGTTQEGTLQTVLEIRAEGHCAAPHFTSVGATRDKVREQLARFKAKNIRRIVALRGDLPGGVMGYGEFRYASDLVSFIRSEVGDDLKIHVACYPETHPQAASPKADLQAYVRKVKAGATSAITQYFFNADAYWRFVDEARKLGADVPVLPGIMPITNSKQLIRFSDNCGAEIPRWIRLRLQSYGDDSASIKAFGLDVVTQLCDKLRSQGLPGLHFYTMNQSAAVLEICRRLNLV